MREKLTEDAFLQAHIVKQTPIYCWLSSGTRLEGTLHACDTEAIFMMPLGAENEADLMMVMKIQISSLMPISAKHRAPRPTVLSTRGCSRA